VSAIEVRPRWVELDVDGDARAFSELFARHRRELRLHAYRIVGSYDDAEDLTQETFLSAWRMRRSFQGRSSFRSWLYRIATNACLSALEQRRRRRPAAAARDVDVLEELASTEAEPDAELAAKETMELVFLVAVQHLPPRQRAVLIARDVLGWSAKETAGVLDSSVASVNSRLQRARATLRKQLSGPRLEWPRASGPSTEERALVDRYVAAANDADAEAFAEMLRAPESSVVD
jgi:RNA polymerase sigma-70 factor, ECF subfamily